MTNDQPVLLGLGARIDKVLTGDNFPFYYGNHMNIERGPGDTNGFEPEPDAAERRRLIQWRLDWLSDEIVYWWGDETGCLDKLEEDQAYWQDELDNPEGEEVPDLDAKGRPIGFYDDPCGSELDGPDFDDEDLPFGF